MRAGRLRSEVQLGVDTHPVLVGALNAGFTLAHSLGTAVPAKRGSGVAARPMTVG